MGSAHLEGSFTLRRFVHTEMDRSHYKGSFTSGRCVHIEKVRSHWKGVFTLILIAYSEIEIDDFLIFSCC